ncbi:class I SAM-dependent methyltransferase [Gracilibacillus sp. D59]|uniref:class I SAM-dependent methyltransferase n=1 Tax=Gracilibacillus sp. D59 TaxID=3457434 RepID=UPI003FCE97C3
MELSPILYHRLIRPKWINQIYIHNRIEKHISLNNKKVLDFGAGTGVNCTLCKPEKYVGIDPDERRIRYAKRLYPDYDFDVFHNDQLTTQNHSIDVILIIAVLHHIPPEKVKNYVKQFRKILKPGGMIVAIEPCFFEKNNICNWYMKKADNGSYIQNEQSYYDYFETEGFNCKTIQRFKKCFLYNELFFISY